MPAHGAQHCPTAATTNPFEEPVPRINMYTAQEIAILSGKLERQLGPEYISTRPGAGGGKVHYLAAEKAINLANEVFGFNGWSSQIQTVQVDFVDENQTTGKVNLGLSVICRVTLRDGTFHEDLGYGHIENCKGKAAAFEKAKKEAATDALKRALRNFGKVLGNCLYDRDYLQRVSKIKIGPTKWDAANLHRHPDYAQECTKKEPTPESVSKDKAEEPEITDSEVLETEDDFGGDFTFDEVELRDVHPNEVLAAALPTQRHLDTKETTQQVETGQHLDRSMSATAASTSNMGPPTKVASGRASETPMLNSHSTPPNQVVISAPGFTTGRAAELLLETDAPRPGITAILPPFNPKSESPSIRRTNGINHTTSAPVTRQLQQVSDAAELAAAEGNSNVNDDLNGAQRGVRNANAAGDVGRRIGAPTGGLPSPLANRGAYKPPGPVQRQSRPYPSVQRRPLAEVNNANNMPDVSHDPAQKRPITATEIPATKSLTTTKNTSDAFVSDMKDLVSEATHDSKRPRPS